MDIDVSKLKLLGKGNFGAVYLFKDNMQKEHVLKSVDVEAMLLAKGIKIDIASAETRERIEKGIISEVVINRVMTDDNIIWAEDCFKTKDGKYCIVFEKMERTLEDRI